MILGLTGPIPWYGKVMGEGGTLAIDDINASGELPFKLVGIEGDNKCGDAVAGVSALRKMLDVDKISACLPSYDEVVLACMPILAQYHIPSLNGGATTEAVIGLPYLHSVRVHRTEMMVAVTNFLIDDLHCKRIALIWPPDPAGLASIGKVREVLAQHNLSFVNEETHQVGETDYTPYLARIKAANPDAILSMSWSADFGFVVKQARELGMTIPIASFSGYTGDGLAVAGAATENTYMVQEYLDLNSQATFTKKFVEEYRARYGADPEVMGANYYEEVYVLKDAILKVIKDGGDPFNGALVNQAIIDIGTFKSLGPAGTMKLLANGGCIKPLAVLKYDKNQNYTVAKTVTPPGPEVTVTPTASQ
jgi:branched-chain amino acid transport system substrate-binding protein